MEDIFIHPLSTVNLRDVGTGDILRILHSIWAGQELYRNGNTQEEFYNILQKNMQPVYDSARRQGYEIWNRV